MQEVLRRAKRLHDLSRGGSGIRGVSRRSGASGTRGLGSLLVTIHESPALCGCYGINDV